MSRIKFHSLASQFCLVCLYMLIPVSLFFVGISSSDRFSPFPDTTVSIIPIATSVSITQPVASGVAVDSGDGFDLDFSNIDQGYFMARYFGNENYCMLSVVNDEGVYYNYRMYPGDDWLAAPFSCGEGTYNVLLCEPLVVDGVESLAQIFSKLYKVVLIDEMSPYLIPNHYIQYDENSLVVQTAAAIAASSSSRAETVESIYEFVSDSISFDEDRLTYVQENFVPMSAPDVDQILCEHKGICWDSAIVLVVMLRSQGIPAQLACGDYSGEFHAWAYVYVGDVSGTDLKPDQEGWVLLDPTYGASFTGSIPSLIRASSPVSSNAYALEYQF